VAVGDDAGSRPLEGGPGEGEELVQNEKEEERPERKTRQGHQAAEHHHSSSQPKPHRRPPYFASRSSTVMCPRCPVARSAGLYIASAWAGGTRNDPGETARTRA